MTRRDRPTRHQAGHGRHRAPAAGDYGQLLGGLERQVRSSHAAAMRAVNAQMLELYRSIGRSLLEPMPGSSRPSSSTG